MDALLDTSWTLHFISTNSTSYHNLFSPSTTQHHLTRYFDRLPQFLASQKPQYVDDLDDSSEKLGTLRDCRYTLVTVSTTPIIQIVLVYQHSTFTFILYTPHLILSKAPATQTKHVLEFVCNTFSIATAPLKLPSALLSRILEDYVSALTGPGVDDPVAVADGLEHERRAALLRAAIGQLKLTVSFSGPVAPHLRTIDLSVPYETVDTLVTVARSTSASASQNFMAELAKHIHLQTGMKLPLSTAAAINGRHPGDDSSIQAHRQDERSPKQPEESGAQGSGVIAAPLRLSKLTSAGFAISIDGKLKLADKAVENAADQEQLVTNAYLGIVKSIVEEAKDQGQED